MEERSLPRPRSTPSIPAPLSLIRPSACAGATWLPTLARTAADSGPHGCRLWPARLVAVQALPRRGAHALPPLHQSGVPSPFHQGGVPSPSEWSSESIRVELQVLLGRRPMRVPASVVRGQNWRGTGAGATRGRSNARTEQRADGATDGATDGTADGTADWAAHGTGHGTGHGARREGCEGLGRVGRGCWCRAGEGDAPGRVLGGPRLSIAVTRGSVSKREATSVLAGALVDWLLVLRGRCRSELCPGRSPRGLWPHSVTAHPARRSRQATRPADRSWPPGPSFAVGHFGPPSAAGHPGPSSAAGHAICRPGRSTRPAVPSSPARRIARSPQP